nr:unnamed protein product [Digitaria exilis]
MVHPSVEAGEVWVEILANVACELVAATGAYLAVAEETGYVAAEASVGIVVAAQEAMDEDLVAAEVDQVEDLE